MWCAMFLSSSYGPVTRDQRALATENNVVDHYASQKIYDVLVLFFC